MEKRAFQRIPADVACHRSHTEFYGTITNLSETGMFMRSQNIRFPLEAQFEVRITDEGELLNLSVKVNRLTKSNGYYDGLGVQVMNPPSPYLDFVARQRKLLRRTRSHHPLSLVRKK